VAANTGAEVQKEVNSKDILRILEKHNGDRGGLIAILEEIQAEYGYLPEKSLRIVSDKTGRSLVDIYGVATFYRSFSLKPRGKHLICACLGTACHVRGAPRVVEEFERQLGMTVNCLGACALGPIVVVDNHYFSNVDTAKVKRILKKVSVGLPPAETSAARTSDK
jgi:NADH-quinone oxidoreductase subunit E